MDFFKDGDTISYKIPRFDYMHFDYSFKIPAYKLLHLLESYRMFYGTQSSLNALKEWRLGGYNLSVVGLRLTLSPDFYNELKLGDGDTQMGLEDEDIQFKQRLNHVGKTSFDIRAEIYHGKSGKTVGSLISKHVRVEHSRPLKIPAEFLENHFHDQQAVPSVRFEGFEPPDKYETYTVKTSIGDVDSNNHVNNSNYFKYTLEAANHFAGNSFKHFKKDICRSYNLIEGEARFLKEVKNGEFLDIICWEDDVPGESLPQLKFILKNRQNEICTTVSMKFEPDVSRDQ